MTVGTSWVYQGQSVLRGVFGLLPAICAIIAMVIFWKYPLTDKIFAEIRDENEARKVAAVAAE